MSLKEQLDGMTPFERKYAQSMLDDTNLLWQRVVRETEKLSVDKPEMAKSIINALRDAWSSGVAFEQARQQKFLEELMSGTNKP